MFDPITLGLIGSAIGGIANKKNPLKGALMGGGLGLAGGAALPYLGAGATQTGMLAAQEAGLGSAAAGWGGAGAGASQASMLAGQEAGLGLGKLGWKGATTGLQGAINDGTAKGLLNTAGTAIGAANTVKSMMPQDQPIPPAPAFSSGGGTPMSGFYNQLQQNRMANNQADMQRRQRRYSLIG